MHTGQHYDQSMSDIFFSELDLEAPQYNLEIGSDNHGAQTGRMLASIEDVLLQEQPDAVLVYGDTNSTLAGALAAAKLEVPVAHVEAGLRSFNRSMPEEINRVLTDHLATLLFAPTPDAVRNLEREGIQGESVYLSGDVMYDAAIHYQETSSRDGNVFRHLGLKPKNYILATVHRAENTDNPVRLRAILEGLNLVAADLNIVLPLHPRTRKNLRPLDMDTSAIRVIEPVGYLDMISLERHARLIATDSGGVQKEAYFYRVPCVTLREETEWTELLRHGWNYLLPPTSAEQIARTILSRLDSAGEEIELYGGGQAAQRIVDVLVTSTA